MWRTCRDSTAEPLHTDVSSGQNIERIRIDLNARGAHPHARSLAGASTNDEALLVQQDPVPGSELDPPVAGALTVNGVATIRAVATCGVGTNGELHRLAQPVAAIPPMLDGCHGRRLEARVEEERARSDRKARGHAVPVSGREIPAQLRVGHHWRL
jgi:hypothetical protein